MSEILTVVALAASAFIGTNLDNLILLAALLSRYRPHTSVVTTGYISGMFLIGVICVVIAKAGDFIPVEYFGLLGVIPILIGLKALIQLFRSAQSLEASVVASGESSKAIFMTVLATQFANGADSIISFSLIFADTKANLDLPIFLTFMGMSGVFAGLAYYSMSHQKVSEVLNRFGQYVTPFILIFVGFYILSNTATDLVAG
jgi:cadmium resistance protein CadD (predicted permease)